MKRRLALALLFVLAGAGPQANAAGCCVKAPVKPAKECFPVLRIPPEEYVYRPAVFSPPDHPVPYSVYYYNLYQQFCAGESADKCIWACEKVRPVRGAALKVGG